MKVIKCLLIFLISVPAIAQDWEPLVIDNKYNYAIGDSNLLSHTLWIDSTLNNVSYLNRIVVERQSLSFDWGNQPQFLMRKMIDSSNGWYHFVDTASFVIHTKAALNDVWVFDTLNGVNAEVVFIGQQAVFGLSDSIKKIALSTADTLVLSKSHGFLQFPDFNGGEPYVLKGIEGAMSVGEQSLTFHEIFDFQVGDVFQYLDRWFDGSTPDSEEVDVKYQITAVSTYQDSVVVERSGYSVVNSAMNPSPPVYNSFSDQIVYKSSDVGLYNHYNNQLADLSDVWPMSWMALGDYWVKTNFSYIGSNRCVSLGIDYYSDTATPRLYETVNQLSDTLHIYSGFHMYHLQYVEGLGLTIEEYGEGEGESSHRLVGYVKNGDTTGVIYEDDYFLASLSEEPKVEIKVFPNPTTSFLFVDSDELKQLWSSSGQLVLQTNDRQLNVKHLSSGIYFLKVGSEIFKTFKE
jgi:hypothetical protein